MFLAPGPSGLVWIPGHRGAKKSQLVSDPQLGLSTLRFYDNDARRCPDDGDETELSLPASSHSST